MNSIADTPNQARVSLARAVYSSADILLMDDVGNVIRVIDSVLIMIFRSSPLWIFTHPDGLLTNASKET